jgi:hypothetical protein
VGLLEGTVDQYSIYHVAHNYFRDGKSLDQGSFAEMEELAAYYPFGEETNQFVNHSFPAKLQASSLGFLCMPPLM